MLDNEKRENAFNDGQENDNNDFNQINDRSTAAENIFAEEGVRMPEANTAGRRQTDADNVNGTGQRQASAEGSCDVAGQDGFDTMNAQANASTEQSAPQSSVYRKVQSEIPYARFEENDRSVGNRATGNDGTGGYGSAAGTAGNGGTAGYGSAAGTAGNSGNAGYGSAAESAGNRYGGYTGAGASNVGYTGANASNGYTGNASYHQASAGQGNQESRQYSYIPNDKQPQDKQSRRNTRSRSRKQKKHMNNYAKAIACAILCGLIIGGCVIGSFAIGKNMTSGSSNSASNTDVTTTEAKLSESSSDYEATQTTSTSGTYTVAQIANECGSSVVAITNKSVSEVQTMFGVYTQESEGSGSGVIISKTDTELLIVTNYHVIEDAEELSVCFNDSADAVYTAQIKGTDSENDLAVVAVALSDVSEDVLNSISIATIGDSDSLEVGDGVVAIGNALGLGQSVTSGIISALDREVTLSSSDSSSTSTSSTTATLLQTDAAINPGNSGGALFNMNGELIGINSAKYASEEVEGMGFAIPMSTAKPIIEELMTKETRTKLTENYGCLNITGQSVSSDDSEKYGVPEGVYVYQVLEDGAAGKAGIQTGDIITSIDGNSVSSIEDLQGELQYYAAGETVEVVIQRNEGNGYTEQTLTVTLDNASEQDSSAFDSSSSSSQDSQNSQNGYGNDDNSGYYYYNYGDSGNNGYSTR